mgnify:CR=1 FL=1
MKKETTFVGVESSMTQILDLAYAFWKSKVLHTACEFDIFTIIGKEAKTSEEVAKIIETDEKATDRLMNALVAIELLSKSGNLFSNTKISLDYLAKGGKSYMGDLKHLLYIWNSWNSLTDSVWQGTSADYERISVRDIDRLEAYQQFIDWRARLQAEDLISRIDISKTIRFLDLGCGSGTYSWEFLQKKPDLKITLLDLPDIIPITKKYLIQYGILDKVELIAADYQTDSIGKNYDMIFLSTILSQHSIWENINIMSKVYDALNPGGSVIIHEYLLNDDRTSPIFSALYSLNMLVNSKSGDTYTETDIWIILKEAWFKNIIKVDTNFGNCIFIAKK